jgi:hypothetical protein
MIGAGRDRDEALEQGAWVNTGTAGYACFGRRTCPLASCSPLVPPRPVPGPRPQPVLVSRPASLPPPQPRRRAAELECRAVTSWAPCRRRRRALDARPPVHRAPCAAAVVVTRHSSALARSPAAAGPARLQAALASPVSPSPPPAVRRRSRIGEGYGLDLEEGGPWTGRCLVEASPLRAAAAACGRRCVSCNHDFESFRSVASRVEDQQRSTQSPCENEGIDDVSALRFGRTKCRVFFF